MNEKKLFLVFVLLLGHSHHVFAKDEKKDEKKIEKITQLSILARVAGQSISNRQVLVNYLLDHPEKYIPSESKKIEASADFERQLQRIVTQVMVSEENKVFSTHTVSNKDLDSRLYAVKQSFRDKWESFLAEYELTETEVRTYLSQKLLVDVVLQDRVRTVTQSSVGSGVEKEVAARKSIESWLSQLQIRYKVNFFKKDSHKKKN